MKPLLKLTCCLVIILFFYSCGGDCPCSTGQISIRFKGYADSEIDSIKLTKYQKGTNFGTAVDSLVITPFYASYFKQSDTTNLIIQNEDYFITTDYDWEVRNLFDNKSVRFSDIIMKVNTGRCGGLFGMDPHPCSSPITSYKQDNVLVQPGTMDRQYFFIK